jgi:hypothetical protein
MRQSYPGAVCSRRHFLAGSTMGIGSLALAWLLNEDRLLGAPVKPDLDRPVYDLKPKNPPQPARARAMISLFIEGGPSHIDLFDPKPELEKWDSKSLVLKNVQYDNAGGATSTVMKGIARFAKRGQSGLDVSDLLPYTAQIVDEITVIRSMNLDGIKNHGGGLRALGSGTRLAGRPSVGSWLTYALGSETKELPAFVSLPGAALPVYGTENWSSGWLPAIYQGTMARPTEPHILNLDPPALVRGQPQRLQLDYLEELNRRDLEQTPGETDLEARIESYRLAARMQTAAKEAFDISKESEATRRMYGIDDPLTKNFGTRCLIARRLVERGVRFVQVWENGWDHHEFIHKYLPDGCKRVDQPSAALVIDLKQRGLLDTTLVHWGGEMGRLPFVQFRGDGYKPGRDHNTDGFTMWLAGGGVKRGFVYGHTDEFGHRAVADVVHHYDYHATLLHLFGLDAEKLSYIRNGRAESLLNGQPGQVVKGILANG